MKLTDSEIRHFKNVLWGTRFWAWFRWVLLGVLGYTAVAHFSGWKPLTRPDWLVAGALYMLVAWPGLCRTYVFHTLRRVIAEDPEARAQLAAAGVKEFAPGTGGARLTMRSSRSRFVPQSTWQVQLAMCFAPLRVSA